MRRDNIVTQKVSAKEADATDAEARKSTAEGEFVILSETKKKITADIEKIQKDILDSKNIKENIEKEIIDSKGYLSEIKKSIQEYSSVLEKIKIEIETEKKNQKDFSKLLNDKQEEHDKDIMELELSYQGKNVELQKEIDTLNTTIENLNTIIQNSKTTIDSYELVKSEKQKELEKLKKEISEFDKLFHSKEEYINKLDDRIKNQETLIEQKRLFIEQLKKDFNESNKNLEDINIKITEKQKELDALDQKVFLAVNREEVLNQKEAFIKSKFIKAGIKYE